MVKKMVEKMAPEGIPFGLSIFTLLASLRRDLFVPKNSSWRLYSCSNLPGAHP